MPILPGDPTAKPPSGTTNQGASLPRGITPYGSCDITMAYVYDSGLIQVRIAAPANTTGRTTRNVRMFAPSGRLNMSWSMYSYGTPPEPPDPETDDSNFTLLRAQIAPVSPAPCNKDGLPGWFVSGVYEYSMKKAPTKDTGLKVVIPPYYKASIKTVTYGRRHFRKYL